MSDSEIESENYDSEEENVKKPQKNTKKIIQPKKKVEKNALDNENIDDNDESSIGTSITEDDIGSIVSGELGDSDAELDEDADADEILKINSDDDADIGDFYDENETNNSDDGSNFDENFDEDYEPENYVSQFDKNIKNDIIQNYHTELLQHSPEEIKAMCVVKRDPIFGIICDPLHKTLPILTKYEKTKILTERIVQLNRGAEPFITVDDDIIDGKIIAEMEFEQKKLPVIVKRPLPNGSCEYWKLSDLEDLDK